MLVLCSRTIRYGMPSRVRQSRSRRLIKSAHARLNCGESYDASVELRRIVRCAEMRARGSRFPALQEENAI
jgi:hypothetical protein